MNELARIDLDLPTLVRQAANQLASATDAATVLSARHVAGKAYDEAKRLASFAKSQKAHRDIITKVHRAQADALEIEKMADVRLADEYDAAQDRREIAQSGTRTDLVPKGNEVKPTTADLGLSRKTIYEARQTRAAEKADPGIVRRTLDAKLEAGEEPTKAALREAVIHVATQGLKAKTGGGSNRNPHYKPPTEAAEAWTHLYGACRALAEWGTAERMLLARAGLAERTDNQASNIGALKTCASTLIDFLKETGNVE
jgi:hypothetical protein